MICIGCGAAYDDKAYSCPYCGKENEKMTAVRQQEQIEKIYADTGNVVLEPVRRANSVTKKFVIIITLLGLLVVVGVVVGILVSGPMGMNKYEQQQEKLKKLEELFDNRDYKAMDKILDKTNDAYSSAYDKYREAVDIAEDIEYCQREADKVADEMSRRQKESMISSLNYDFYFLFAVLDDISDFEQSTYAKGEEAYIKECRDAIYDLLKNTYKLTEDEITKWSIYDRPETEQYEKLSALVYERLSK